MKAEEIVGIGTIDPDIIYESEYCKLKQDEFCEFSIRNFDTELLLLVIYSISENGNKLNLSITVGFGLVRRFSVNMGKSKQSRTFLALLEKTRLA